MLRQLIGHLRLLTVVLLSAPALGQPLPTDPQLVTGTLDNGLEYIVRRHAVPPGRAVVWIHMHTGSLNETDRQRGLAHYLEHMAFNGSANFEPGSLVPFFQSLGMTFGRDQNAFTSFDQTTYQLSLPDCKPETLTSGMRFFADVVGRLSLLPEEIEKERQIIQEERRRGLSGRQRTMYYVLERMAPGSLYGERIPIGTEETIDGVMQEDFRDYYGRWYGAANATLMVVADTDPAEVVEVIRQEFGTLPKGERAAPQDVGARPYAESFAIVTSDPEVRSEQLTIIRLEPARPVATTVPMYREDLVGWVAQSAMNRRLSDKVAKGGTSYLNARVSMGNDSNAIYTAEMSGRASPGKWADALAEMSLELQRARKFGFSDREVEDVKKEIIAGAERDVETEATIPSQAIIARLNSDVSDGAPLMSPDQRLAILRELLPSIGSQEVGQRFDREFDTSAVAFVAVLPASASVPTESELLDLGRAALAAEPTPEAEAEHATTLMAELPKPGAVVEGAEDAATRVWSGWLNNNVRVHHRFMDERKNQVAVHIDLIGGEMLETAENRGITSAATLAWSRPATKTLSSTDIRDLMTGAKVSVRGGGFGGGRGRGGGGGSADSISLTISGSPEDLEKGFQLAHLLLTEPRIEDASFDQFRTQTREQIQESLQNPLMFGARVMSGAVYPESEARVQPVTVEQVDELSIGESQAWLDGLIARSPIEVVVVGDLPRDRALELVTTYLGSIPSRERVSKDSYASIRRMKRPPGPRSVEKTLQTPTAQAFVMSGFYGTDDSDVADARALTLAARILSTRMVKEVREDAQLVYSIGASSRPASVYPGFGMFAAAAPTEPGKTAALVAKLASMYEAFAREGPSAEELDVARKQMANTLEQELQDPGYWGRRLQRLTFRGAEVEEIVEDVDAYQAISADQIRETFARYHTPERSLTVTITPVAPGAD